MPPGISFALIAFTVWGLFPLYFRQVAHVAPLEVVAHRVVWAWVLLIGVLAARRHWGWLGRALRTPRVIATFAASAVLVSANWLLYVWSVENGHVIDASLGYFINPLVNVLLGYVVLRERPRTVQWLAIGMAAAGVLWLAWHTGRVPTIALVLALTFGLYGLVRKIAPLGALEGLTLETLVLAPFALALLTYLSWTGRGGLVQPDGATLAWLVLAGPLTAVPLLLFAAGARLMPLTTLGLVQYITPSLQFAIGVWIFHEPLPAARLIGFVTIWLALALYSGEALWRGRRAEQPRPPTAAPEPVLLNSGPLGG